MDDVATWTAPATVMAVMGLLGAGVRYWMAWAERQADRRRAHEAQLAQEREEWETALTARLEAMQGTFLAALEERDSKLDRHRSEHLEDGHVGRRQFVAFPAPGACAQASHDAHGAT